MKAQILWFAFFFLSGPFRLKNNLMSGKNNSDVDDEEVQENSGKLFIFYLDFLWHHTYGNRCAVFLFKLAPMANVF